MRNVGARFYDAIDESNARNDLLEADLAKDIESSRLFRWLLDKFTNDSLLENELNTNSVETN